MTKEEKLAALRGVEKQLNAKFQKEAPGSPPRIYFLGDHPEKMVRRYLSTMNPAIDRALGGGIRLGVPIEIAGAEGSGKTTMALTLLLSAIRQGKTACYVNIEQDAEPLDQMEAAGFTKDEMKELIIIPAFGYGERLLNILRDFLFDTKTLTPKRILDVMVLDSLAALAPAAEMESVEKNGFEGQTIGRHASMVGKFFRVMCGSGALSNEGLLVSVNQIRKQIGSTPLPDISTGGNPTKFFNKTRIWLRPNNEETKALIDKSTGEAKGKVINFHILKNNMGIPDRRGTYTFFYGQGLDIVGPIFEEAMDLGVIYKPTPTSTSYFVPVMGEEPAKINGKDNTIQYLRDNPEVFEFVKTTVEVARTKASPVPEVAIQDTVEIAKDVTEEEIREVLGAETTSASEDIFTE